MFCRYTAKQVARNPMQGSIPVVRSVTAAVAVAQSPSRIPHLSCHILQRRSASHSQTSFKRSCPSQQQRPQSTTATFDTARSEDEVRENSNNAGLLRHGTRNTIMPRIQQPKVAQFPSTIATDDGNDVNLYNILEQENPDLTYIALLDDNIGTPFIRYAPDELFTKALLMLEPAHFIEDHKILYRHLRYDQNETFSKKGLRTIEDRFMAYGSLMEKIIVLRRESGNILNLDTCRQLLKWAGSLGNESLALAVFQRVMKEDQLTPDLDCYNYFMQALNWSHAYSQAEKFKLRVLPRHIEIRAASSRPDSLSGHRATNEKTGIAGIREEVLQAFTSLVREGFTADEFTFINLMTAMGREGDIEGVLSILKSVWNIDLTALEQYGEDEIESPTFYEEGHSLRPTEHLLYTLAHIFGSNNDARTAWTLVDYVSRNYALPTPRRVWTELLEWYMVLSLQRSGAEKKQGLGQGQIGREVFDQLFEVMKDQPNDIRPNTMAYYIRSRMLLDERHLEKQVQNLHALRDSLDESLHQLRGSMERLQLYLNAEKAKGPINIWKLSGFSQLRRRFITDSLEFEANHGMMQHAVCKHLLQSIYWAGGRKLTEWERRRLPQLVEEFHRYLPRVLTYRTTGGTVAISDADRTRWGYRYEATYQNMCRLRLALDVDNHDTLLHNILNLEQRRII